MPPTREQDEALLAQIQEEKAQLLREIEEIRAEIDRVSNEIRDLDDKSAAEELESGASGSDASQGLRNAKKVFNDVGAKKGIKALVDGGHLDGSAVSIAKFLYETPGLSKTRIGELLGEPDELNLQVLREYLLCMDFTGKQFDKALREFLWSFRLPGESQKIDRLMEQFAKRYCECVTNIFTNTDTAYILAFATIMLNTSLHNPSVKNPMTLDQFLNMNKGIDNGKDVDETFLTDLYCSIKTEQFKMIDDDGDSLMETFVNSERCGWLTKEGGAHKTWKRRWFRLCNGCLYYFENEEATQPKGTIPLENLVVRELADHKRPNCFEISAEGGEDQAVKAAKTKGGKVVQGKHSSYKIQAADKLEMEEWIRSIRAAMSKDPIYELYRNKRDNMSY